MKLVSWNVNGLRAVYKKGFSDFLTASDATAVFLQEIKVKEEQLTADQQSPAPYSGYFFSAERPGYSGVGTFVKDTALAEQPQNGIDIERFDKEGRVMITPLQSAIGTVWVYNCYFPSGTTDTVRQDYKYDFLESIYDHLKTLPAEQRERLVVCGDFNICHQATDIHHPEVAAKRELSGFLPDERAWMDTLETVGLYDSFRCLHPDAVDRYSWWTYRAGARQKNKGWRIDYFFISESLKERLIEAEIHHSILGSDHCPVSISLDLS